MYKVLVFHGTVRKDNRSQHALRLALEVLAEFEQLEVEVVTPRTFPLSFTDEGPTAAPADFSRQAAGADGYLIVTPEYNRGYPGSLKYLLDLIDDEARHKPVALVGVSSGLSGGGRVVEALLPVLRHLGMVTIATDVLFPSIEKIQIGGQFSDPEKWKARVRQQVQELILMLEAVTPARQAGQSKGDNGSP